MCPKILDHQDTLFHLDVTASTTIPMRDEKELGPEPEPPTHGCAGGDGSVPENQVVASALFTCLLTSAEAEVEAPERR